DGTPRIPCWPGSRRRPGPPGAASGPIGVRRLRGTSVSGAAPGRAPGARERAAGAVLDRDLLGTLDLVERDAQGRLVVVDLKTAAREYTDLQVEASLQLSIDSYATA